jgi:hypothetical protein
MPKYILIYCFVLLGFSNIANSQYNNGRTYQEIGIMTGPVFFQSDFGERNVFENYIRNNGISAGIFYYVSAIDNYASLRENFKLRLELSYMKCNLNHYGQWVDPNNTKQFATQLRAMGGKVEAANLGFQIEYYPWKTDDYSRDVTFSPYLSLGAQLSSFTSGTFSTLGPLGNTYTTPDKYIGATRSETGVVGSLTTSIGTRYMLDDYNALSLDARVQYYFSDWVDGLNPDSKLHPENQSNDWSTTINIGYIYYFQ